MTNEQQYKKNQKLAKFLKRAAPFVFWICIGLAVLFLKLSVVICSNYDAVKNIFQITSMGE